MTTYRQSGQAGVNLFKAILRALVFRLLLVSTTCGSGWVEFEQPGGAGYDLRCQFSLDLQYILEQIDAVGQEARFAARQ